MLTNRTSVLTTFAMLAFAGNSLLCRMALKHTAIDANSFITIRLISGAITLWLLVQTRSRNNVTAHLQHVSKGNWLSALALFVYAAAFSFAYINLSAATGALLLFGSVQATMIGYGIVSGERLSGMQWLGFIAALAGVVALMLPGSTLSTLAAPPLSSAALMIGAGIAWGIYSLRGRGAGDATRVTAGNFLRAAPMAIALSAVSYRSMTLDTTGVIEAIASGAITSGMGYAIWYAALPMLKATHAAIVQLSVPVLAAIGGVLLLGESLTWRMLLTSLAILGGIALVIIEKQSLPAAKKAV